MSSPTYCLDEAISRFSNKHLARPKSTLRDRVELLDNLNSLVVPDDYCLVHFDVVSLSTNIQSELVIRNLENKWNYLKNYAALTLDKFIDGIVFLMNSIYFQFNNKYYDQILGTPIGETSPGFQIQLLNYWIPTV